MGSIGDMGKALRQVQKLQADMERVQAELAERTVEANAGGGAVKAVVRGDLRVERIVIAPEAIDPDDPEMLADLVLAAVNEGLRLAQEMMASEMAKLTGGLKIPGL
jgi:hypothetical protein